MLTTFKTSYLQGCLDYCWWFSHFTCISWWNFELHR